MSFFFGLSRSSGSVQGHGKRIGKSPAFAEQCKITISRSSRRDSPSELWSPSISPESKPLHSTSSTSTSSRKKQKKREKCRNLPIERTVAAVES